MTATVLKFPSRDELAARFIDDVLAKGLALAPGRFRDDLRGEIIRLMKPLEFESFAVNAAEPAWFKQLAAPQVVDLQTYLQSAADELRDFMIDRCRRAIIGAAWTIAEGRRQAREAGFDVPDPPNLDD